ncbi:Phospho-2-dehydro-3-deoxyheptonate aldolase 2, chloroplastic [Asimina triloba]
MSVAAADGVTALQLPKYRNKEELDAVRKMLKAFPAIVFAGKACHLEDRLIDVAMGKIFLLQGGDCTESFKEFNANNIRDTFRILLWMGVVLCLVNKCSSSRSDPLEEKNGVKLTSYRGDNINGDAFRHRRLRCHPAVATMVTMDLAVDTGLL